MAVWSPSLWPLCSIPFPHWPFRSFESPGEAVSGCSLQGRVAARDATAWAGCFNGACDIKLY